MGYFLGAGLQLANQFCPLTYLCSSMHYFFKTKIEVLNYPSNIPLANLYCFEIYAHWAVNLTQFSFWQIIMLGVLEVSSIEVECWLWVTFTQSQLRLSQHMKISRRKKKLYSSEPCKYSEKNIGNVDDKFYWI